MEVVHEPEKLCNPTGERCIEKGRQVPNWLHALASSTWEHPNPGTTDTLEGECFAAVGGLVYCGMTGSLPGLCPQMPLGDKQNSL